MSDALAPYDGDLTIAKAAAHAAWYVTEYQTGYADGEPGDRCWEVILGAMDPPTWDTGTLFGRGHELEDAWRRAIAAMIAYDERQKQPGTDPVTPARLAG